MCPHLRKQLYRVIIADGRTQVTERCLDCGINPRSVPWVSQSEARVPVEDLPLLELPRARQADPGQRTLFDEP